MGTMPGILHKDGAAVHVKTPLSNICMQLLNCTNGAAVKLLVQLQDVCLCRYLKRNRVLECPQCKNGITKLDGGCNHIM